MPVMLLLLASGCDGSLTVVGNVDAESCELSLWANRGPIWGSAKARKVRFARIDGRINVHWTISGPVANHWIEISCPGYELFRSREFEAPSAEPKVDLGQVHLTPSVSAKSP